MGEEFAIAVANCYAFVVFLLANIVVGRLSILDLVFNNEVK